MYRSKPTYPEDGHDFILPGGSPFSETTMTTQQFETTVTQEIQRMLLREAKERYEAGVALPQGWPSLAEQRAYWEAKDAQERHDELNGGVNDWRFDDED